jgi:hypothetical protein
MPGKKQLRAMIRDQLTEITGGMATIALRPVGRPYRHEFCAAMAIQFWSAF